MTEVQLLAELDDQQQEIGEIGSSSGRAQILRRGLRMTTLVGSIRMTSRGDQGATSSENGLMDAKGVFMKTLQHATGNNA